LFVVLIAVMLLAAPTVQALAPARQPPEITLSVVAGYGGAYRQGQWVPLRLRVANAGGDFAGEIRVRAGQSGGLENTTYLTPLDLPQGARKQLFVYASLQDYAGRIQVEIVDGAGGVVRRESVQARMVGASDVLFAVLTESPRGALDLTARPPGPASAYQTQWLPDQVPPRAEALAGLDVLLIYDTDTGALSSEQVEALRRWVLGGGHLILAGGEAWQRTSAAFADLLPVTLRGSVTVDSAAALGEYLRLPDEALRAATTAADSVPRAGSRVLAATGGVPLLVRGRYGGGAVDFLAVDPGAEPLRSWAALPDLWYTLITSRGQQPSWAAGFGNWSGARAAAQTTLNSALPSFVQLCGFLALYIVLLGPVNYLALKRLNRREWAWITVPALVVLFSVLAYTVGFNLRGSAPVVNRLTVVRAWSGAEEAQVQAVIGVQSARRRSYDIAAERGYTLRPLPGEGIGLNVPVAVNEGTRYVAEDIAIDAGTVASLVSSGYAPAPALESSVAWTLTPGEPVQVAGRVTNQAAFALEDAVLLVKGAAVELGTLPPGESASFDFALGPQDAAPLTLGNPAARQMPYSYSTPWALNPGGAAWCYHYVGMYLTVSDVMGDAKFSCDNTTSRAKQEIRRRYRLLSALVVDADVSGGRGDRAYVFAWARQPAVGMELVGQPFELEDTTLYLFELPVGVAPAHEVVEIPPGMTTWAVAALDDPTTLLDAAPTALNVGEGQQAVFQFMPLPALRLDDVSALTIKFVAQGAYTVALWDWDAQRWRVIPAIAPRSTVTLAEQPGPAVQTVRNLARFVGPENAVRVRILNHDPAVYSRVDEISLGYQGVLAAASDREQAARVEEQD